MDYINYQKKLTQNTVVFHYDKYECVKQGEAYFRNEIAIAVSDCVVRYEAEKGPLGKINKTFIMNYVTGVKGPTGKIVVYFFSKNIYNMVLDRNPDGSTLASEAFYIEPSLFTIFTHPV